MYKSLYSHIGYINNRKTLIKFVPDFLESVAIFNSLESSKYFSDLEVIYGEKTEFGTSIYASEFASWFIEEYQNGNYRITITNKTPMEINTPLGQEFNCQLNQLLKEARFDYYAKRKKELRLYLLDKSNDSLTLIDGENMDNFDASSYKYSINRPDTSKSYINRGYPVPISNCFIIARIEKTVASHGAYIDYLEPVYIIPFDFTEGNLSQGIQGGQFNYRVIDLAQDLLRLLLFTIQKEYRHNAYMIRIRYYNREITFRDAVISFKNEIMEGFEEGNTYKLRKLAEILETQIPSEKKII